jgi:hypothetical protein
MLKKSAVKEVIDVRFEVFMAVKIQVLVFWVVTPYSVLVGYHFTL